MTDSKSAREQAVGRPAVTRTEGNSPIPAKLLEARTEGSENAGGAPTAPNRADPGRCEAKGAWWREAIVPPTAWCKTHDKAIEECAREKDTLIVRLRSELDELRGKFTELESQLAEVLELVMNSAEAGWPNDTRIEEIAVSFGFVLQKPELKWVLARSMEKGP